MPSIGQILDLLEAISRRDWSDIANVGKAIAESERKKKHYEAANRILDAVEIATSHGELDQIGTLSAPTSQIVSQIPSFIDEVSLGGMPEPVINQNLRRELKEILNEWAMESKLRHEGLSPRHTLLLYGPPGCGKTLLAKYIAQSLKRRMFVVRFDTLISSFLGETGGNIRKVFEFLSSNRCVLLLDELDAIAKLRDDKNELGELKRVVISLLQNIDTANTQSLLIAATNHPHMLDPALWRRFQTSWELQVPTNEERLKIFDNTFGKSIPEQVKRVFVENTREMTGSDLSELALAAKRKLLVTDQISEPEGILLVLLEKVKQRTHIPYENDGINDRLISLALALKKVKPNYSFNNLAQITGISHSTLHSRSTVQREKCA